MQFYICLDFDIQNLFSTQKWRILILMKSDARYFVLLINRHFDSIMILWQILISFCKFLMLKALKWDIFHLCASIFLGDIHKEAWSFVNFSNFAFFSVFAFCVIFFRPIKICTFFMTWNLVEKAMYFLSAQFNEYDR